MPRHTAKKRNQTKKTTKSRKNCVTKKQVKKIVKRQIAKTVDTLYLDHKMRPAIAPATNDITPWGVNSNLARGTVTGDTLPVNQLDNILKIGSALVPVGSSMRKGDEIFLKSIKVQLRLTAPVFSPAIAPNSTAINKVGQDMVAKVRLLVVFDTAAEQSIQLASTTTGVLNDIYDDLTFCTAAQRQLPTFKGYNTNKRFKVLHTKHITLDTNKAPYKDINFTVRINKKITFIENANTCLQGIYIFAMSDYPSSLYSAIITGPRVQTFWLRYYYSDQ